MEDPGSATPLMTDGVSEIKEVSKEFNRSLSLSIDESPISTNAQIQPPSGDVGGAQVKVTSPGNTSDDKKFIVPKDFELLKVIGIGAFGKVLQVRNRGSSKIFAMKVISKRLIKRKGSYVENILAERNILSKIANHPFIVTMHASFQTKEKLFIIMDFCAGGELFLKVAREGHFRERTAAFYLAEITLALEHLHSVNVLHRDLKPENILLGSDGHVALTDFGLAKDFTGSGDSEDGRARTLCGTIEYMAPEMVARKWYGKGADFWSMGCIAYEMLSGLPPFSSKKGSKELFKKIMNERIRMPDGASAGACKLLKGLLNRDASKRLGAARGTMFEMGGVGALKQQPFFSGLDWGKLELKEIHPPEDFSVENDEDLRHFHDEFVNMALPRSVKEMSNTTFLPRRCESENFRGFSFIGENFPMAARSASEQEHYWNNVDDDGQSLSECASSVFGDDLGEISTPEPVQPVTEKKKRPPRKKKKKQQSAPPLETTNECSESKGVTADRKECSDSENKVEAIMEQTKASARPVKGHVSDLAPEKQNHLPQLSGMVGSNLTQKNKAPSKSLDANAKERMSNSPTKPAPQASVSRQRSDHQQRNQGQRKPIAPQSYAPKPGTWASKAVGKSKPNNNQQAAGQLTAQAIISSRAPVDKWPAKAAMVSVAQTPKLSPKRLMQNNLSPDWRNHVVSPHRSPHRMIMTPANLAMKNVVPPPPIPQPDQKTWPSLGDFPPPPGAKGRGKTKQNKPMGAWGKA